MLKAIFWDNDGVLVDTEKLFYLAAQQVLATVGVVLTTKNLSPNPMAPRRCIFRLQSRSDDEAYQWRDTARRNDDECGRKMHRPEGGPGMAHRLGCRTSTYRPLSDTLRSSASHLGHCRPIAESLGSEIDSKQYLDYVLVRGQSVFQLAQERGVSSEDIVRLRQERDRRYERLLETEPLLISGARQATESLHMRYAMGIVTSSAPAHFAIIHRSTGLLPCFDFVLMLGAYARTKPAPDPYLAALHRSGLLPDECLVVEDSERGLAAAKSAGLRCVIVPNDFTRSCPFVGAERVVNRLGTLVEFVTSGEFG